MRPVRPDATRPARRGSRRRRRRWRRRLLRRRISCKNGPELRLLQGVLPSATSRNRWHGRLHLAVGDNDRRRSRRMRQQRPHGRERLHSIHDIRPHLPRRRRPRRNSRRRRLRRKTAGSWRRPCAVTLCTRMQRAEVHNPQRPRRRRRQKTDSTRDGLANQHGGNGGSGRLRIGVGNGNIHTARKRHLARRPRRTVRTAGESHHVTRRSQMSVWMRRPDDLSAEGQRLLRLHLLRRRPPRCQRHERPCGVQRRPGRSGRRGRLGLGRQRWSRHSGGCWGRRRGRRRHNWVDDRERGGRSAKRRCHFGRQSTQTAQMSGGTESS